MHLLGRAFRPAHFFARRRFCRRWRDIGGKIWVDLECKQMHLGQHNFRGDLAESLKLQNRW